MQISTIIAIVVSLLLIGFLHGIEAAFISANKFSLELNKKQGTYSGRFWGKITEEPTRFLGTLIISSSLLLVLYIILIGNLFSPLWQWLGRVIPALSADNLSYIKLFAEFLISTFILLFIVFGFRAAFRARSTSVLSNGLVTFFVNIFYFLFAGFAILMVRLAEWILKYIINVKLSDKKEMMARVDVDHFLQYSRTAHEDDTNDKNKELLDNALSIGDIKVRECLVPRKEIIRIEKSASMQEVKKLFVETQLSKLVVFENNIDSIVGYIHQLDMFKHPSTIEEILLPIPVVPDNMSATDLINKLSKEQKSIAWVIDEFGGTAGIVTMEDLLEEIFGDIKDEYDNLEEFVEKQLSENEYLFSGRLELDYIKDKYRIDFNEDVDAETLSGYIIEENEDIPKPNERIIIGRYEFNIIAVSGTRIETVKLKELG